MLKQKALALYAELKKEHKTEKQLAAEDRERMQNLERGMSQMLEKTDQVLEKTDQVEKKVDEVLSAIDDLALQMRQECTKLVNAIFEVSQVHTPTTFIILPNLLEPTSTESDELLELEPGGKIMIKLGLPEDTLDRAKSLLQRANSAQEFMDKLAAVSSEVITAIEGGVEGVAESVAGAVDQLFDADELYLYLVDQLTGEPVLPSEDDGADNAVFLCRF